MLQTIEKHRSSQESKIIKKSENCNLSNSGAKNQIYKMCSKLYKLNQLFLTKI